MEKTRNTVFGGTLPEPMDRLIYHPFVLRAGISLFKAPRERRAEITEAFTSAVDDVRDHLREIRPLDYAPKRDASARLLSLLQETLLSSGGFKCESSEGFKSVDGRLSAGGNALLFANHTSIADTFAVLSLLKSVDERLIERTLFIATREDDFKLSKAALANGLNRIRVWQPRSFQGKPQDESERMRHDNASAMVRLSRMLTEGGHLVVYFPEGRYDQGALIRPDPSSSTVFEIMHKRSGGGADVFPAFIDGERGIVGLRGGFLRVGIDGIRASPMTVKVGEGIKLAERMGTTDREADRQRLVDDAMMELSKLIPPNRRGHYGK